MVSHTQRPKVGGSQDPNSPRKLRQRPKPGTQISFCQKCGCRREENPRIRTSCIGCAAIAALKRQPPKAAADGDSDNTRFDNTMTTEDNGNDLMKLDSISGSNDNGEGEVPHTHADEPLAAAAVEDNSFKTDEIPVPAQKNISFQDHPAARTLPSELLSRITPWTPVDSSAFVGPPAAKSHITHMAATASNMASVPMNASAAYYAGFPGPLNSASSMAPPAFTAPATTPPRAAMNQASMSSSATASPQSSMVPPMINNSQGFMASPTLRDPSTSMSPPAVDPYISIMTRPSFTVPPTSTMGTAADYFSATINNSTEMNHPMIKAPIPIRIIRPRIKAKPPRMRRRPPTATRPPPRPALDPRVHMLPSPSESSPAPREPPAATNSPNVANPPSVMVSPPSTLPPVDIDKTESATSPAVDGDTRPTVSATPEPTFPVSTGPALTNIPMNESSPAIRGPICTSLAAATDVPTNVNPQATMDCSLFTNLSAALESENPQMIEAHLKPYGPPPTNAGNYLYIIQTSYCYTSRAADGIPMKLDQKTKKEMIHLEELVTDTPLSPTPPFFMPPRSLSIYLLKLYRHEVYFTYPFFNMNKFMDAVIKLFMLITKFDVSSAYLGLGCSDESNPSTPLFQCSLFMILWHSVYFANLEQEDKLFASRIFWKCAKFFMTDELLKTSCLAAVQTQLIIAVALNSSNLQGNESKIPAELAYHIAQSLGIDNERNQPTSAAAGVHDADRQAWYGCVMMNLFSQTKNSKLPLNSGMSKSPLATSRYQSPAGSVDFNFFINCVIRAEELEKILENIRRSREPVLEPFTDDQYNQFDTIAPILREKLHEFIKLLPTELYWGVSGLPDEYVHIAEFNQPKATSNANFMHLRAMLFRPILMQIGIDGYLESNSITYKIDPVVKDRTLMYAMSCINTAISLLDFLYKRYVIELKSNKEWWWDPYHTSTAGLVLVMAQTSATLWSHVQISLVVEAWKACQEMLGYGATDNHFHQNALQFLWGINKRISGVRVLENNYDALPQLRRPKPVVSWSFHRTPYSQFVNPCSPFLDPRRISYPTYANSNSKAPLKALKPKLGPSALSYAATSSSNTAPFTASAASTIPNTTSNVTAFSGCDAVANATFANYNPVPYAPLPKASIVPPFAASSSFNTVPYTAPSTSGAIPPFIVSAFTIHPVSTSSGSGPSPFLQASNIILPVAPESAVVPYAGASNASTVPYTASSEFTIAPYATSLHWNTTPHAASPESATFLHTDTPIPKTVPTTTSSCDSSDSYTSPYTAFSNPSATLYTEESANLNAGLWPDSSAFNLPSSSSSTTISLSPSNPNLASFGNIGDVDDLGTETQAFLQASTEGLPLHVYYNPDDDPSVTCNWQN
ncbi:hypothetical protein GGI35DRAFT_32639 [Trichoderma velutinum]